MDLFDLTDLATPWAVHVVVTLRVAEHIAAGTSETRELAAACGADPDSLERVIRHLVGKGVFEEPSPGEFSLNEAARALITHRTGLDLEGIGGRMAHAWGTLLTAVRTGKPAYHEAFGRGFWDDLEAHPDIAADFDALMGPAGHGTPDPEVLLDPAGWASVRTVVDVGGGTGSLLAEILKAHPAVRGILVDLPRAVARASQTFEAAGVTNRVTTSGQSFFDPLPAGADLYVLKKILGDWPDAEAAALLECCAAAARPNGRVVINGGITEDEKQSPELLMLVLVGGRNRPLHEFRGMARAAGLKVQAVGRRSGRFLVECMPI